MHAERCPVCHGTGKTEESQKLPLTYGPQYEKVCHGCGGRGWVEVSDNFHNGVYEIPPFTVSHDTIMPNPEFHKLTAWY